MDENSQEHWYDPVEINIEELRNAFREEADELIPELEGALLELEKDPEDKEQIGRIFRALHTIKGSGRICEFHDISAFTHELESVLDSVRSGQMTATTEIITLTLAACDQIKTMLGVSLPGGTPDEGRVRQIISSLQNLTSRPAQTVTAVSYPLQDSSPPDNTDHPSMVIDTSVRENDVIDEEGSCDHETTYKRLGEILVETGAIQPATLESALMDQQQMRGLHQQRQMPDAMSSIRVATDKLDSLVNLVGELMSVQAHLSQTVASVKMPALHSIAEEIERLIGSLRDTTMNIRMLPIGTAFSKFGRLVRDLSAELGKEIELTTAGDETELDKTVIEKLGDPLIHIIRNCIDHGIEHPDERLKAGKPRKGTLHLSAVHSGAHVLVQISDDGAGLDGDAIHAKAVEKGLIQADAQLPEQELWELILAPGFTTAQRITDVSGRGIGMDVVKRTIDELHGTLRISSKKGQGTTITLKLPLTLAIIEGFLTRTGGEHFIFPLSQVEECIEMVASTERSHDGWRLANVRGRVVPYVHLRDYFGITEASPAIEQIVITNVDNRRVGVVVDTVLGQNKTVLKSLGRFYKDVEVVSGATIMGDGTVAMILNIPNLLRQVEQQETQLAAGDNA